MPTALTCTSTQPGGAELAGTGSGTRFLQGREGSREGLRYAKQGPAAMNETACSVCIADPAMPIHKPSLHCVLT